MRIYTRTGDSGQTGLMGGLRVAKDSPRIDAVGTLDEACAALGVAATQCGSLEETLRWLQSELFVLGADLATPLSVDAAVARRVVRVTAERAEALEQVIDAHEAVLEPLTSFILPGGSPGGATLHLARAIVRRAERRVTTLLAEDAGETNPATLVYLNRLGDLLFVLARIANKDDDFPDIPWRPDDQL